MNFRQLGLYLDEGDLIEFAKLLKYMTDKYHKKRGNNGKMLCLRNWRTFLNRASQISLGLIEGYWIVLTSFLINVRANHFCALMLLSVLPNRSE